MPSKAHRAAARSGDSRMARRAASGALVGVSAVVLVATALARSVGAPDPVPVSSTVVEQATTTSTATSPAASPTALPDPVLLAAGTSARRVTRAGLDRAGGPVDIPDVALAAYQRAAAVINDADNECRLDWSLVAAIGYVESNHGRDSGSRLDEEGVARPAIRGARLDGTRDTQRIKDTDAGLNDGDQRFDRAVGPMQILPSTWSLVGVDADGDDVRDPQDVGDAALAAAVYLCFGSHDLSSEDGRRAAVRRYNPDDGYVDLVLRIAEKYADADTEASFVETIGALSTPTLDPASTPAAAARDRSPDVKVRPSHGTLTTEPVGPSGSPSTGPSPTPSTPPTTTPPTTTPPTTTPPTTTTPTPSGSATPSTSSTVGPTWRP